MRKSTIIITIATIAVLMVAIVAIVRSINRFYDECAAAGGEVVTSVTYQFMPVYDVNLKTTRLEYRPVTDSECVIP